MSAARMAWRPLRWLFSRRAAKTLLWLVLIGGGIALLVSELRRARRRR